MALLWLLAGAAVEAVNTMTRKWSAAQLGRRSVDRRLVWMWLAAGFLFRLAATGLVLVLAFRHSALSGLASLVGYWICRWAAIWWIHRSLAT